MSANINVGKSLGQCDTLDRLDILISGNVAVSARCFSRENKMIRPVIFASVVGDACGSVHINEIKEALARCWLESDHH